MNCKVEWDMEFIRNNMTNTFLNDEYKKHREEMLLSLEESLLPETQAYLEYQNDMMNDWNEIRQLQNQIRLLRDQCRVKTREYGRKYRYGYDSQTQERRQFIMKCLDDNCRGFLSTQYKCGQCSKSFCNDCYQPKLENHVCNEDDRKTVELLNTDTRKCPKCQIIISKIEGCNQMWCTNCNTAFDWHSGRIINGVIHNPHYFAWQQRQGQEQDELDFNMCHEEGNIPLIRHFRAFTISHQTHIRNIIQAITHFRHVIIPPLRENQEPSVRNRDLRVAFMNNEIDRDKFKWLIQKRDKASQKKRLMLMLFEMFVSSSIDLLNNMRVSKENPETFEGTCYDTFTTQFNELIRYVNTQLLRISKLYNSKPRQINERLQLV